MCLQSVHTEKLTKKFGWKEFTVISDGKLYPLFMPPSFPYKTDRWITDKKNYRLKTRWGSGYKTGFHMYRTKLNYISLSFQRPKKVYFKDYVAHDDMQIVARSIYICDKTKRPPKGTL